MSTPVNEPGKGTPVMSDSAADAKRGPSIATRERRQGSLNPSGETPYLEVTDLTVGEIAHRHQRGHGDVGFGHRGDDVHNVGLALRHRHALRVRLAARVQHAVHGFLQHRAERGTIGLSGAAEAARPSGGIHDLGKACIGVGGDCR